MVVKIELYYEVLNRRGTKIPHSAKPVLDEFLKTKVPKSIVHSEKIEGEHYDLTYKLLSNEDLVEKIRTGKG